MTRKEKQDIKINKSELEQEYEKYFKYLNPDEKIIIRKKERAPSKQIKTWVSHNTSQEPTI